VPEAAEVIAAEDIIFSEEIKQQQEAVN